MTHIFLDPNFFGPNFFQHLTDSSSKVPKHCLTFMTILLWHYHDTSSSLPWQVLLTSSILPWHLNNISLTIYWHFLDTASKVSQHILNIFSKTSQQDNLLIISQKCKFICVVLGQCRWFSNLFEPLYLHVIPLLDGGVADETEVPAHCGAVVAVVGVEGGPVHLHRHGGGHNPGLVY